jgi:glycine oxidase
MRAAPIVQDLPIMETWAGFRPGTPDDRPVLGADPRAEGVFHATGHFRNGILLTPITAEVIADTVQRKPTVLPIASFSAARFQS